jgi:hypothetical protein
MKRLLSCIKKQQDENSSVKLKTQEFVTPNMSWPLNETRNALSKSSFINIPNEIILHIFRFLSVPDLCNISLVCRSFKMIADHDDIWKSKCNSKSNLFSLYIFYRNY